MKTLHALLTTVLILLLFASCEEADNSVYPSVLTDYACLLTGYDGQPARLRLDNGTERPVYFTADYRKQHKVLPTYTPDSLYRVVCVYASAEADGQPRYDLYSLSTLFSKLPQRLAPDVTLYRDPVYLQRIWLSGGYLNMVLQIKALNGKHSIGLVDLTPEGVEHGRTFTFYHQVIEDVESYRQELYTSIPLGPYSHQLTKGDTLTFQVNLYDKGLTDYRFVME